MDNLALQTKVQEIKTNTDLFSQEASAVVIANDEQEAEATELRARAISRLKRIEELRTEHVKPYNDEVKKINNTFKSLMEPLETIKDALGKLIIAYGDKKEAAAFKLAESARIKAEKEAEELRKEQERLEEEAKKAKGKEAAKLKEEAAAMQTQIEDVQTSAIVEAPKTSIRTETGLSTRKQIKMWRIKDYILLRKERPELFIPDEKTIGKLIAENEELPGVEVYYKTILSQRV